MAQASKGMLNTLAMIVAFLAIGFFLFWLSVVSEPTEIVVMEEPEVAQAVSVDLFSRSPAVYQDDLVQVDGVEVQSLLGADGVLLALPNGGSYPVRLDPSSTGFPQLEPGIRSSVTGRVLALTDSIVDAWAAESLFADDTEREALNGVTTYILATEVTLETAADTAQTGDGA